MPSLIVSLEWIRSFGPLGFAWGNLALTQMDMLHLLQFIDYGGTYIITFWIVCINSIIYYHFFLKSFPKQKLVFFFAFLLLINSVGLIRLNMELGAQLDRTNADFFATQDIRRTQATAAENRLSTRVAGEETRGTIRTQGQEDRALTAATGLEYRRGLETAGEQDRALTRETGAETRATRRTEGRQTRATQGQLLRGQERQIGLRGFEERAAI